MKWKEGVVDFMVYWRSFQFVGVNGGYELLLEDFSMVENILDNDSIENEVLELRERVLSVVEVFQFRFVGMVVVKISWQECQLF